MNCSRQIKSDFFAVLSLSCLYITQKVSCVLTACMYNLKLSVKDVIYIVVYIGINRSVKKNICYSNVLRYK